MAEQVQGGSRGFAGRGVQAHMGFLYQPPAFFSVARRAGGDKVFPGMPAAPVTGDDMVDRKVQRLPAAILAGISVPPEDFPLGKMRDGARGVDQFLQLDDRRIGER
jgi:hypothetical protein